MPTPAAPLDYPSSDTITSWEIDTRGVRDQLNPTEAYEINSTTWKARVFCKWSSRWDVINWLLGKQQTYVSGGVTKLSRLLPRQVHPDKPRILWSKVLSITGSGYEKDEPFTVPTDGVRVPTYRRAEIELLGEFAPFKFVDDDDLPYDAPETNRFVENPADTDPSGEFLQLPQSSGLNYLGVPGFSSGDPIPGNQFAKAIPQETFSLTWHYLPEDVWEPGSNLWNRIYGESEYDDADIPYMGCINKAPFFGRAVGTVLFLRPDRSGGTTRTGRHGYGT